MIEDRDWLKNAIDLAEASAGRDSDADTIVEAVIRHQMILGIRDGRAIDVLCSADLSDTAQLHVRRLWENGIRVQYILKDPENRARQFVEEAWVEEYRTIRDAEAFSTSPWGQGILNDPRLVEKKRVLEETRQQVNDAARGRAEAKRREELWSIHRMAKEVGNEDQYVFLYAFLSQQTHGSPSSIKNLLSDGGGRWDVSIRDWSGGSRRVGGAWLLLTVDALAGRRGWADTQARTNELIQEIKAR